MVLLNIYRLKSTKTNKYCWIYSTHSEYEDAVKAKKGHSNLFEASRAFQDPGSIKLDKKLGIIDKNDTAILNQLIVNDIVSFDPDEVMSQRLSGLYLSVVNKHTLKKFIDLMIKYPQIDFMISNEFLKDENKKANDKINILNQSTAYWCNVASSTELMKHSPKENSPFNLNMVKVDQDSSIPVFYREYYPTHFYNSNEKENLENKSEYAPLTSIYQYIRGLKYKIENNDINDGRNQDYKNCLKLVLKFYDKLSDEEIANLSNENLVDKAVEVYSRHFYKLLAPVTGPIILAAIPAHNHKINNIVSRMVDRLSSTNDGIINGNIFINKVSDEVEAHSLPGLKGRNKEKHESTWNSKVDYTHVNQYVKNLPVIIIDDLTTSGNSLKAANEYFDKMGFANLYDFVFGKSTSSKSIIDKEAITKPPYDGLILDLDQTFYNSAKVNDSLADFYFPDLINKLKERNIKFVFVTQSSENKVARYCGNNSEIMSHLFTTEDGHTIVRRCYKPSSVTIKEAIQKNLEGCNNILGVGNNENDIMAYRRAGIDTALATWGNPIKNIFSTANYILENEKDLLAVLQNGAKFLDIQDIYR